MPLIQCPPLPADTEQAAKLAFCQEDPYLKIGGQLNLLLNDLQLSKAILWDEILFASFWPLSMMTILQFRENLSDHQADAAIRTRLDLKYALHLPLDFPGFAPSTLYKFRERLNNNPDAKNVIQELINRIRELIGYDNELPENTDQILVTIATLNRLETVFEVMSNAVETLAVRHPEWLLSLVLQHWYGNYRHDSTFLLFHRSIQKIEELLECIGEDGEHLLAFVNTSGDIKLENLAEIQVLRQEWRHQFNRRQDTLELQRWECSWCSNSLLKTAAEITNENSV